VVLALYRDRGSAGETRQRAVTTGLMALMSLMVGAGLRRGFDGGGELRHGGGISRCREGRRGRPGSVVMWPGSAARLGRRRG
jgi:hypothetical protein